MRYLRSCKGELGNGEILWIKKIEQKKELHFKLLPKHSEPMLKLRNHTPVCAKKKSQTKKSVCSDKKKIESKKIRRKDRREEP